METADLTAPDLYINRELAFLEFNRRVLEQAKKDEVPLLERVRFLCITSANLDEFFEIRVAGLKQQAALRATHRGADNLTPSEQLRRVSERTHELMAEQYRVLNDVLFPLLDAEGIRFRRRATWDKRQRQWLKSYFNRELEPILTPIGLDPAHPFPRPLNKSLSFMVTLDGKDAFGRSSGKAIVQAPRALPRVVRLPESHADAPYEFVFLSSIIHAHMDELFPGMKATGCYQFRVTRNSDLFVDEEEIDDLLRAMEGELSSRRFGDAVRMELAEECPGTGRAFPAGAVRSPRQRRVPLQRARQPDPADGDPGPRRAAGPEVPRLYTAHLQAHPAGGRTSSAPSARGTCCCTTRSTRSPRSSISCVRRPTIRTSWPFARRYTAPVRTLPW